MVFNTPIFLFIFLPAVFVLYRLVPGRRWKDVLLCAASLVFYAFGGLSLLPLLVGSVLCNYLFGLLLRRPGGARRLWCALAVLLDLGLLCVFKYLDFLTATANALFGLSLPPTGLSLPLGISFFTFQGISYVADVYRDPGQGSRSFLRVLLYIAFFPRLLAGPIVRYHEAAAQLDEHPVSPELTAEGLRRFARGLAKKLLLAETAAAVANAVFALDAELLCAPLAWLGAVCYCLQIFFDFSGYSDMAIGLGELFGFRFPENFDYPYVSRSLTEFWRRWHITLNRWFVDYLYIPLGGSRRGRARTVCNKLVVFLCTGLWHGAGWTFLLWGLWHGLFVSLEGLARPALDRLEKSAAGWLLLRVYTMLVVILGFVMFRAESLRQGFLVISRMFSRFGMSAAGSLALETMLTPARCVFLGLGLVFCLPVLPRLRARLAAGSPRLRAAAVPVGNGLALCLLALCLLCLAGGGFSPFIYLQF